MKHLVLYFFYFTLVICICSCLFAVYFYYKSRFRLWLYYIFFFAFIGIKVFLNSLLFYVKLNITQQTSFEAVLYNFSMNASYIIIFILPFLFHSVLGIPGKKKANLLSAVFAGIGIIIKIIPYFLNINNKDNILYYSVIIQHILTILILLYCIIITFLAYRKINIRENKNIALLSLVFSCFIILDTEFFLWFYRYSAADSFHYWLNAFYYFIWCVLILLHGRNLQENYSDSSPSLDLKESFIKEYNLTEKECEIIRMILTGKSNREIGETLFISIKTVKNHIYNIYQKINVKNRMELSFQIRKK